MRKLTIRRNKAYPSRFFKDKVYIEDAISGEITINGTRCRKLGTLKNGEEAVFEIGDSSLKVYIITDKLSKNYSNDLYQIPEGSEDIFLSGRHRYNMASGNAFRFDNNTSEEALRNRTRGTRKGALILAISAVIAFVIGFMMGLGVFDGEPEPKDFATEDFAITLTSDFISVDREEYYATYSDGDVVVFVTSYMKSDFTSQLDFDGFAETMVEVCDCDISSLKSEGGQTYFYYDARSERGVWFRYYCYLYEDSECFWLVQFVIDTEQEQDLREDVRLYAASVKFD